MERRQAALRRELRFHCLACTRAKPRFMPLKRQGVSAVFRLAGAVLLCSLLTSYCGRVFLCEGETCTDLGACRCSPLVLLRIPHRLEETVSRIRFHSLREELQEFLVVRSLFQSAQAFNDHGASGENVLCDCFVSKCGTVSKLSKLYVHFRFRLVATLQQVDTAP